jgi:hypothetical protein
MHVAEVSRTIASKFLQDQYLESVTKPASSKMLTISLDFSERAIALRGSGYFLPFMITLSVAVADPGQAHVNFLEINSFKLLQSLFPAKYEL